MQQQLHQRQRRQSLTDELRSLQLTLQEADSYMAQQQEQLAELQFQLENAVPDSELKQEQFESLTEQAEQAEEQLLLAQSALQQWQQQFFALQQQQQQTSKESTGQPFMVRVCVTAMKWSFGGRIIRGILIKCCLYLLSLGDCWK